MRVLGILSVLLCAQCATSDTTNAVTSKVIGKMTVKEANDLVKSIEAADYLTTAKTKHSSGQDSDQLALETDQMKQRKDEIRDEHAEEKFNKPVRMTPAASLEGEVAADALQAVQYLKKQMSVTTDATKKKAMGEAMAAEAAKAKQASALQHAQIMDGKDAAGAWVKMVEAQKVANEKEFALSKLIGQYQAAEVLAKAAKGTKGWKMKLQKADVVEKQAEDLAQSASHYQGIRKGGASKLLMNEKADIASDKTPEESSRIRRWEDWMSPLRVEEQEASSSTKSLEQARRQRMYASNAEQADDLEARKIANRLRHNQRLINPRAKEPKGWFHEVMEGDGIIIIVVIGMNAGLFWWVMSKKKSDGYSALSGPDDVQLKPINRKAMETATTGDI